MKERKEKVKRGIEKLKKEKWRKERKEEVKREIEKLEKNEERRERKKRREELEG